MWSLCSPDDFFLKKAKNKAIRKHKLPSHSTNNLESNKPCGQYFINAFCKGLPGKKGKLNLITSTFANKYAAVKSSGSSSIVRCSEKPSVITKNLESYSKLVSSSLEMKVLTKKFLLMNYKNPQTYSLQVGVIITR